MSIPLCGFLLCIFFIVVLASALIGSRFLFKLFRFIFTIVFVVFVIKVLTT